MKKKPIELKIVNKGNKKAEILIYDVIGEGWFGGISAANFAKELKALGDVDDISVRINSEGGNVFDGITIYNQLASHKADITVDIDGLAASIASIIAMAGDTVRIAANAMFMIHDPWIIAAGSAEELRTQADLLDKVRGQLIDTYDARSTAERDTIDTLMADETWMTAQEALDYGFVDEVTEKLKIAAHVSRDHKDWFKNVPENLVTEDNEFEPVASDRIKLMRASLKSRKL